MSCILPWIQDASYVVIKLDHQRIRRSASIVSTDTACTWYLWIVSLRAKPINTSHVQNRYSIFEHNKSVYTKDIYCTTNHFADNLPVQFGNYIVIQIYLYMY